MFFLNNFHKFYFILFLFLWPIATLSHVNIIIIFFVLMLIIWIW